MELGLNDRVAAITGASQGIGRAIARGLAGEGVHVVMMARGQEQLDQSAEQVRRESGVRVLALRADVSDEAGVR